MENADFAGRVAVEREGALAPLSGTKPYRDRTGWQQVQFATDKLTGDPSHLPMPIPILEGLRRGGGLVLAGNDWLSILSGRVQ